MLPSPRNRGLTADIMNLLPSSEMAFTNSVSVHNYFLTGGEKTLAVYKKCDVDVVVVKASVQRAHWMANLATASIFSEPVVRT